MLKKNELASRHSCLSKALPDEPIFVLRGKDPLAAQTVRAWAAMAQGTHEDHKIEEAYLLAEELEKYAAAFIPPPPLTAVPRGSVPQR